MFSFTNYFESYNFIMIWCLDKGLPCWQSMQQLLHHMPHWFYFFLNGHWFYFETVWFTISNHIAVIVFVHNQQIIKDHLKVKNKQIFFFWRHEAPGLKFIILVSNCLHMFTKLELLMIEIIYFNGVLLNCRKGYDSKNYVKRGLAGRRKRGLTKMKMFIYYLN